MEAAVGPRQSGRSSTERQVEAITPEQAAELRRLVAETGASESRFCAYLKIRNLAELQASRVRGSNGGDHSETKQRQS